MTSPPAVTDQLRRILPLLLVSSMMSPLTLNILMPSLPALATTLNAPRETVQLTLSLYLVGMALSQFIMGPLADRYGRRPVIIISAMIFAVSSLIGAFSDNIEMVILARILQALGATGGLSIARTIIGDLSSKENTARLIAYVTMTMVLAPMAAPSIGSALDSAFGWKSIFLFCTAMGTIVAIFATFQLRESRPAGLAANTASDVIRRTLDLAKSRSFLRYVTTSSTASASFFTFLGGAPHLVIETMHRSPAEYGRWFALMGAGYALGNFTSARLSYSLGIERMMGFGNLVALLGAVAMGVMAFADIMHPAALFLPGFLVTYGNGLVIPNSMAGALMTNRNAAGAASGMMGFCQMSLGAITSYLVGKLLGDNAWPMVWLMLITSLIAISITPPRFRKPA